MIEQDFTLEQVVERARGSRNPEVVWTFHTMLRLDELESEFRDGRPAALLEAIVYCALEDLQMPLWVRVALKNSHSRVVDGKLKRNSWDEVFGTPYPKGRSLKRVRFWR